jgi:hypothetical protein
MPGIVEVLEAARLELVANQVGEADQAHRDAINRGFEASGVAFRKLAAGDLGQDFDARGRDTHPNDAPFPQEEFLGKLGNVEAELADQPDQLAGVVRLYCDPEVLSPVVRKWPW